MKNKFKGFTLVELIVVMAIITVLMAAIMQLFKPIRTVYVDAVQYESQHTAQNGVVKYITESVRFATDMGIYNKDVSSASKAADEFAEKFCINNGILDEKDKKPVAPYDATKVNNIKNEIKKYAEVIIIANDQKNEHKYRGKTYWGRLIRRKNVGTTAFPNTDPSLTSNGYTADWRIAMGEAYYGENTFNITLTVNDNLGGGDDGKSPDDTSDDGILNVAVSSTRNGKRDISDAGKDTTKTTPNINRGSVLCRNLVSGGNGVKEAGIFDVSKYEQNRDSKTKAVTSGTSGSQGKKTYIVFLTKEGKDSINKVIEAAKTTT